MSERHNANLITWTKILFVVASITTLSACGGGSTGVGGSSQAADPTVPNMPIAYVKRPTPTDNNGNPVSQNFSDPETIQPGAHLIVKMSASVSAPEIDVTNAIIGDTGDVRDPAFSDDGTKLVFALHKPDVNGQPPETWNIYEYDLTKPLSQTPGTENPWMLMDSSTASAGDDIEPHFMPGADIQTNTSPHGRIVFSSTRGSAVVGIELDEGTGQFPPTIEAVNSKRHAFNLHVMPNVPYASSQMDSSNNISQISFNMSDDLFPTMIRNMPNLQGRILYSRWEHSPGKNQMTLYTMNPDGTDVQLLYGENSHNTGTNNSTIEFTQPRETLKGNVMVIARPFTGTFDGGDPVRIDVNDFIDNTIPVLSGATGQAQISLSNDTVVTSSGISPGGRFNSIFPLQDGTDRAMVSYSLCYVNVTDPTTSTTVTKSCSDKSVNLTDPNTTEAPPLYGIFIFNTGNDTLLPITPPQAGTYYTGVVAARNLSPVPYIPNSTADYSTNHYGILNIRSVYDMDGTFDPMGSTVASLSDMADPKITAGNPSSGSGLLQRPAMFLRIVKGVYLPDSSIHKFDSSAYSVNRSQLMRQIIGYAPIDPDGSVQVKVPANVPLSFSVLDKNGRRIGNRHGFWLTVRPGGTLSCYGCHDPKSNVPHGRTSVEPPSINPGATATEAANNMFVDTVSTFTVNQGDTMAMARTQTASTAGQPNPLLPSPDIVYSDVWTDSTVRAKDTPFSYLYSDLNTTSPANTNCASWNQSCRITIDYESDIQPIWSWVRSDTAGNDVTCISCHHAPDNVNPPDGQLDLTNNASTANAKRFVSYQDLLTTHDQVDATGAVVNSGQLDANGNPIPLTSPNSMVAGSAATSTAFFNEFTNGATTPHCTVDTATNICVPWLSPAEMKLILEWLDIGAQYYNNPFAAP